MNFREWPLALFTLLFQISAGTAAALYLFLLFDESGAALLVLASAALATLLSLFHLGRPVRSPRSIGNVGRSWLSREIILLLIFDALAAALVWREAAGIEAGGILAPATVVFGLVCVFVMSRIYVLPAVPDWNSWRTPAAFFSTLLTLGGMTASVYASAKGAASAVDLRSTVLAVLVAVFFLDVLFAPRFGLLVRRTTPLGFRPNPAWPAIFIARLILFAAAILLWMIPVIRPGFSVGLSIAALSVAAVSEFIGRLQFYDLPLGLSSRKS